MSVSVMSLVWKHAPVESGELLVLLAIADHCDDSGTNAWPSIDLLCRKSRLKERRVQAILRSLQEQGLIYVEWNKGGTVDTPNDRRPNRYTILLQNIARSSGVQSSAPQDVVSHDLDVVVSEGDGVHSSAQRGALQCVDGVQPSAPKPSIEPSIEPSLLPAAPVTIEQSISAQNVVAAYVDRWMLLHKEKPLARQMGQLAREARQLIEQGANTHRLVLAAEKCATDGHARLDSAYAWLTANGTRETGTTSREKNLRQGVDLVAKYAAEESGLEPPKEITYEAV